MSEQAPDPRLTWAREGEGREIVSSVKHTPDGWSVTTEWFENGELIRRDCEVAIRRGPSATGGVFGFIKRFLGKVTQ